MGLFTDSGGILTEQVSNIKTVKPIPNRNTWSITVVSKP